MTTAVLLAIVAGCLALIPARLYYSETKGPFRNLTQVVDLEPDGDLDVVVSHTRWEEVDISWAGIGRWINDGKGQFTLLPPDDAFAGFAAGVGDLDQDGDADMFVQDFNVKLLLNPGGARDGVAGDFQPALGGMSLPSPDCGYRDMGGSILMGDLNGDGLPDAFVAGCCYGKNATDAKMDYPHDPSFSWLWINDGSDRGWPEGRTLRLEALDEIPVRGAALGDVDGDGDVDVLAAIGKPALGTAEKVGGLVLLNDGTGSLSATGPWLGEADSTSVALGDVNGDDRPDALVGTAEGAVLFLNQGSADFTPSDQAFEAARSPGQTLAAGLSSVLNKLLGWEAEYVTELLFRSVRAKAVFLSDLDADGDLDAVLARVGWAEVWINDGQGSFTRTADRMSYAVDTGVAVGDFNGDGRQEIFAGGNNNAACVWRNNGRGRFWTP